MIVAKKTVESTPVEVTFIGEFPPDGEEIAFRRVHQYLDDSIEFYATTSKFKSFSCDLADKKDLRIYTTPPLEYCSVAKLIVSDSLKQVSGGKIHQSFSVTFETLTGHQCVTNYILTSAKRDMSVYVPTLIFELKDASNEF